MKRVIYTAGLLSAGFLLGWFVFSIFAWHGFGREAAGGPGLNLRAGIPLAKTSDDFVRIVKAVSPSVVNISSERMDYQGALPRENTNPLPDGRNEQSLGSGVIVSPDGYIITNDHVIADADHITVTLLDNMSYEANVIGADPKTDLALLKIGASNLPAVRWGNSDALRVGQFVLAIGNPFSLSHSVTMGIISAVGRANVGIADYEDFIQTDAAINPGNSGGPLVDERGEVIGINTAIFSRSGSFQGIGFAVPSNMVLDIMDQLKSTGRVTRGWVGITMQDLTPDLAGKFGMAGAGGTAGVLVSDVARNGPAWKAGLRRGDIIVRFGGQPVQSPAMLRNLVAETGPGRKVSIRGFRRGRGFRIFARVAELPADLSTPVFSRPHEQIALNVFSGLGVVDLTADISRQLGLPLGERGVVVANVYEDSPAGEGDIRRGDVIEEIERRPVRSLAQFNAMVGLYGKESSVVLLVNRSGKRSYVLLRRY